jgi:hypothetical protein
MGSIHLTATDRENAMSTKNYWIVRAGAALVFAAIAVAMSNGVFAAPAEGDAPAEAPKAKIEKPAKPDRESASKLSAADREKIQRVITLQIRAFERNDEAIAFSYATPESRRQFGTPRAFMEMVRVGYSALFKNSSREFLEAATINGTTIQPLRLITLDGETIIALYTMERQPDQEWRVGGCDLSPATLSST